MEGWCRRPFRFGPPLDPKERKPTEFDHVDFTKPPEKEFWEEFLSRSMPDTAVKRIDVVKLEELVHTMEKKLLSTKRTWHTGP